jgi:23S rRNA pseudouridine2605 synthase
MDNNKTEDKWRINKFIAAYGDISRRKADEYLEQGRVTVNNITVRETGFMVMPGVDKVEVDGEPVKASKKKIYIALNKPAKIISSASDEKHRTTVVDLINVKEKIYPIGRLDYESTGLILLTNDGELTNKLLHPKFKVYKTYLVKLSRPLDDKIKKLLEEGVKIEGRRTEPAKIKFANKTDKDRLFISIYEGRNRQVRKMFEKFGIFVNKLHRTEYGGIKLGSMPAGGWRYLSNEEIEKLKSGK